MSLNFFRKIFNLDLSKKTTRKGIRRKLELLGLEERVVPATFTVINNSDSGAGSLRQAIIDANATVADDIIDFNFATGTSPYTITLAAALPSIETTSTAGTLTITGLRASSLTIDANQGNFSIFTINTGSNLSVSGVTVTGANTLGSGGAFKNNGTLTVTNSTLSGNSASNNGGGILNHGSATLNIFNSTISGNISSFYGGGIFNSTGGTLTVSNSTFDNNTGRYGGGISNQGTLTISNSTLSGNIATMYSGGIYNQGTGSVINCTFSGNSAVTGGGIYNSNTLNIANTIIANSTSGGDYAGGGTVNVTSPSTAANNLVSQGTFSWATTKTSAEINLGTLANNGGPTQTLALLTGSVAIGAGDATISNAAPVNGLDQRGINRTTSDIGAYSFGIQVNTNADTVDSDPTVTSLREAITLANTTAGDDIIDFNFASGSSPYTITLATALPNILDASTSGTLTITGLGASSLTIDANKGNFSIFTINTGANLTISGVTFSGAKITSGNGGAFNNSGSLTVSNSTISGNSASNGGGIFNNASGTATITNSTISSNSGRYGGGINNSGTLTVNNSTISGNSISNQGGGIYNNNNASLTVTNSTISGNSAGFAGGGIYNNSGILTLSNSTLTGNSVYKGGALYNRGGSIATITNSTFSGNTATRPGGGGGIYNDATLNIANTIIANSTKGGDYNGGVGGTVNLISSSTAANNLVSSGSFSWATTKTSAEINLGPLSNNGGPTKTIALGTGSVAIGAGDATISNAAPVNGLDQRGVTRSTTAPSIGAFEFYPATQVTLTTSAAGSASGSAFTTQPVITIRDSLGNPVNTTASVTMTVSGNGTTVGTTTVKAVNGVATFTNVGISGTAGTAYTLTFTSAGLTSATQSITPTFGTATQATLSTNAAGSASGSAFTTQPVITIKDAFGNTVTNSTAPVTMTVSGNGTTVGTTTVNAVAGVATFTNVGISGTAGTAYTLTFASAGLTSATQSITPTFGLATQATLSTNAAGSVSGSAFTTQPVITIKDAFGNTVTNSSASVTMTVSGNGTTVGTTTVNAVNGIATFTDVGISGTAGTSYTLTFASAGLTSATQSITPTFGTATQATLSTNAAGSVSGSAFTTQPVITIKDAFGNNVTNSTASVAMTVSGNGTTVGTTTVNAVNGIATFTDVGISGTAGTAYTLTFASAGLTSATQSITPTFGTATQATLSTNAAGSVSGSAFTTQPVITIKDAFGNNVTNSTASVAMTVSGNGTTVGTTTVNAVNGIATFTDVGISGTAGTAYTLTFASAGLTSATQSITPLGAANTPTFGAPTSTPDGFTVQISNYDANFTYAGTATVGSVSISGTGLVTVTGVSPNTSSTATITTTQTNFVSGSGQVTATSLAPTAPLVVGTPASTSSGGSSTVTLYDPVTGAEAGTAVPFPGFSGPVKVVSGDFNGDGVAELIAGAGFGGGPAIAVLNSQTGEVMEAFFAFDQAFTGGVFVAVQDVNNDGILDIIASAGPGGGPEVRIFDGNGLTVLRSFYAYAVDFTGGVSVASIDFNNDGILDLVTGAGPSGAPHVKVYDGATNAIISQWYAYATDFTGGVFVAVGDTGNDGTFEVVTGAGAGGSPVVAVWDPNTGALLAQFMAYAEDFTGGVRVGINDGNTDGIADILTGAGPGGGPQVNVFNFPALDLLFSFYSGDPANTGGVFVG
jgi:CSLREA domain-containing protein